MEKITALSFAHITHPVTFKVVTVTFCEDTVTISFSFVPLTLINILVSVNHTAFTLWQAIYPVTVVSVAIFVKESASSVLLVFIPVACVLTAQFIAFIFPVGTLTVALVDGPHSFVLVTVCIELDSESFLAVITPIANIFLGRLPFFAFDSAIFCLVLLFDPIDGAMSSILLSFGVIDFPKMHELTLLWAD